MIRSAAVVLASALIAGSVPACSPSLSSEYAASGPVDRPFVSGGTIHMDLSAGQYVIKGVDDKRLRVRWTARNPEDAKLAKVVVDVRDTTARIVTDGPSNNFHVDIDVPSRSNIILRLSAGELNLSGIEGNKDISAWAGEVRIGVGDASQYGKVSASLTAGEIRADPFGEKREGVFPSFSWTGKGSYELSTRLTAGQITFSADVPSADENDGHGEDTGEKPPGA
jgi:hypothetical protein